MAKIENLVIGQNVYIKSLDKTERYFGINKTMSKMIGKWYKIKRISLYKEGVRIQNDDGNRFIFRIEDLKVDEDGLKRSSLKCAKGDDVIFDEAQLNI